MIVSLKDVYKMIGMWIVSFCAVIVCGMFLNYYLDLVSIENLVRADVSKIFYEAQCGTSKVVSGVSGGCLLLTTVVLLCFYIGHYMDTHQSQLGVMKALGYTKISIAKKFWVFGLPVFAGTAFGYLGAHLLMPKLYEIQNKDGYLPDVPISFHFGLCLALVALPTIFFSLLAVGYSFWRLRGPVLCLIRQQSEEIRIGLFCRNLGKAM